MFEEGNRGIVTLKLEKVHIVSNFSSINQNTILLSSIIMKSNGLSYENEKIHSMELLHIETFASVLPSRFTGIYFPYSSVYAAV